MKNENYELFIVNHLAVPVVVIAYKMNDNKKNDIKVHSSKMNE